MLAYKPDLNDSKSPSSNPIRVMLVDDSVVARSIFGRILSGCAQIKVACQAENPEVALDLLSRHQVDIILLDIEMPRRSGLDALPDLLQKSNGARILVVSSFAEENGPGAIQALSLGACDTLGKPGRSGFTGRFSQTLLEKVIYLGNSERPKEFEVAEIPDVPPVHKVTLSSPECIAIGASTGGIPAIYDVIGNLRPEIDCPIFITQHLPHTFMSFFAKQLGSQTDRSVCVAEPGMKVLPNHIYIAPGQSHLVCRQSGRDVVMEYFEDQETTRYCPSVDIMFASLAKIYGDRAIGVVLSGMGSDGSIGAECLSKAGSKILVQDAATSVVWGMPGNISRLGLASAVMPAADIGKLISKTAGRAN
ncbi:chemotaxis-specific protein-glutamate methyltransferase CheB [Sphingorhabdus arenilitoris]|uniref:protein-glutamate methylesterase n=1 Tax=Sphingorhabdus arenilitoris TaxID=1490041 RepID=A0ABV8RFD7_9SPHN